MSHEPHSPAKRNPLWIAILIGGGLAVLSFGCLCGILLLQTGLDGAFSKVESKLDSAAVPDPKEIDTPH